MCLRDLRGQRDFDGAAHITERGLLPAWFDELALFTIDHFHDPA